MTLTPAKTLHAHIVCKKDICGGGPIIKGTRTSVVNIVGYHKLGLSPEEIRAELPHLNLAQIYDALAYYYDNQKTIDELIEEEMDEVIARKYPAGRY
ncbi:MAG: DUF433 domain-containing protein [Thermodesulfovibrionales bacterium]|nr:DUF433 domain-containing protein [Thermodesulfovibrionales bacterium]